MSSGACSLARMLAAGSAAWSEIWGRSHMHPNYPIGFTQALPYGGNSSQDFGCFTYTLRNPMHILFKGWLVV